MSIPAAVILQQQAESRGCRVDLSKLDKLAPKWQAAAEAGETVTAIKIVREAGFDLPGAYEVVKDYQREHWLGDAEADRRRPWWQKLLRIRRT